MAESDYQQAEQLQRAKRRWKTAAIVATCMLVAVVIVETSLVVALNVRLENEQRKAQSAMQAARAAQAAVETARRKAAAASQSQDEPETLVPVNYLIPTDQMYRTLPDEDRDLRRRIRNELDASPLDVIEERILIQPDEGR